MHRAIDRAHTSEVTPAQAKSFGRSEPSKPEEEVSQTSSGPHYAVGFGNRNPPLEVKILIHGPHVAVQKGSSGDWVVS